MRAPFVVLAILTVAGALGACSSHARRREHEPATTSPAAHPDTHADPASPAATGPGATAGEGNGVVIEGTPDEGTVSISVAVTGDATVALDPHLGVQRRDGDSWTDVHGIAELSLRDDCHHDAPGCVHLVPGAELLPPSWLGTTGDAQCVCTRCATAPAGTYRFVAKTCDGSRYYPGVPFALAAP